VDAPCKCGWRPCVVRILNVSSVGRISMRSIIIAGVLATSFGLAATSLTLSAPVVDPAIGNHKLTNVATPVARKTRSECRRICSGRGRNCHWRCRPTGQWKD
jgi:hypothetical protein